MATAKEMRIGTYCDEVLSELAYMIQAVRDLRDQAGATFGADEERRTAQERHLTDIAEYLDWKLQILTTACPFEWKGLGEGVQDIVSVSTTDRSDTELAGGYTGG
jgi:hypothetical protein